FNVQVLTNNVLAGANDYRAQDQTIKVRVGTSITNAQIRYFLGPRAVNDRYTALAGTTLAVAAPGVLANDGPGVMGGLVTSVISGPASGTLTLNTNGSFNYTPAGGFLGGDSFTYQITDSQSNASVATVSILVTSADTLFIDDFTRPADPGPLAPWLV